MFKRKLKNINIKKYVQESTTKEDLAYQIKWRRFSSLKTSVHVDNAFIDSFSTCSCCLRFLRGPFSSCIISLAVEHKESLFYSLIFLLDQSSWSLRWVERSSSWIGLRSTISSSSFFINSALVFLVFSIGPWINILNAY